MKAWRGDTATAGSAACLVELAVRSAITASTPVTVRLAHAVRVTAGPRSRLPQSHQPSHQPPRPAAHPAVRLAPRLLACSAALLAGLAAAQPVGEVDTAFKLIGPDHKIVVEAYDDPKVGGVTCFVSRAKTGGIKGAIGLAEDKAEASIACRQVGPLSFPKPLPKQEEVFNERLSILFKKLRIVRMVDSRRNALVYLTYSDQLIDGSPKNSITAVPVDRATPIPVK